MPLKCKSCGQCHTSRGGCPEKKQPNLCRANGQDICLLCRGSHEIHDLRACLFTLAKARDAAEQQAIRLRTAGEALHLAVTQLLIEQYHEESTAETRAAYLRAVARVGDVQVAWKEALAWKP